MKTLLITVLNLIIITASCFAQGHDREVSMKYRASGEFYAVHANSSLTVVLKPGDNESVIVGADAEYQKQLLVSFEEGVLKIEVNGKVIKPIEFNNHSILKKAEAHSHFGSDDLLSIGSLDFRVLRFSISGSIHIRLKEKHKDSLTEPFVWLSEHSFLKYCKKL